MNKNRLTPYKKDYREEDDGCGQRGRKNRERNLLPALFRSNLGRFAHLKVAEDVFQHHHGVVDQAGKRQRQTAQHHRVYRPAARADGHESRQSREGNGKKNRGRGPHASQK